MILNAILENSLTRPVTLMWMSRPVICKIGPVKSENTPKVFFFAICLIFYCLSCLYQSLPKLVCTYMYCFLVVVVWKK